MSDPHSQLKDMLIRHEGFKLRAYLDTKGIITIGVGRNIESMGITEAEALGLLANDVNRIRNEASNAFPWFLMLDLVRQDVICDMLFIGMKKFLEFKAMIAAVQRGDWERAASEMLNSVWASEVKGRAVELAEMMRTGAYRADPNV